MAVAPASMADQIIVLDGDDEEDSPKPCCSASTSSFQHQAKNVLTFQSKEPIPTHITTSPFASAKKDTHVLQAENNRLFTEFVEHCSALTEDCPEVLTYLQARHSKASSDYLSSVAFRNTLGSCLTRAQVNRSKTFVYINELCTVLRQHSAKRRQLATKVHSVPCTSTSSSFPSTSSTWESKVEVDADKNNLIPAADDKQPSNSEQQEDGKDRKENLEVEKTANRASRKQVAYLENLLKVYNDEIQRLQQAELSLDDLGCDESSYIQENKLKRKMMKIYEKLCELKGCSTLTGRVIENRISYNSTRYPEINKRIERFINSPEAHRNPPDFPDILHVVVRANERYKLCLTRKQLNQIAKEAFRDVVIFMQQRRHQDLLFNFGSHLTDHYKPASDPALLDPSLHRKLKSNREVALSRLEEVITKYAVKQEDTEEQERTKRQEKNSKEKEGRKSKKEEENKKVNGVAEEEEEEEEMEDEEEDESSDPDIEEELQVSAQQDGPDDEENEGDDSDQAGGATNRTDQTDELSGSISALGEEDVRDEVEEPITNGLGPWSDESKFQISPQSYIPSSIHSPNQSEPLETDNPPLSNGRLAGLEEPLDSPTHASAMPANDGNVSPTAASSGPLPLSPVIIVEKHDTQTTTNGTLTPSCPRTLRSRKRKREEMTPGTPRDVKHTVSHESEADIPLHTGVVTCRLSESTRANTPTQELVSSSRSTPPPKKNKVDVATQCDPDEIIVLSDSE